MFTALVQELCSGVHISPAGENKDCSPRMTNHIKLIALTMRALHEMGDINALVPKRLNSTNDLKSPKYVFVYKMNAKYCVCNAAKAN